MNKKEKQRRKKVLERLQRKASPAIDEREYFDSLEEAVKKYGKDGKLKAVLYDRVSSKTQEDSANLKAREPIFREKCEAAGIEVVGYFCETIGGWSDEFDQRKEFFKAVKLARKLGVVLIVPCPDRLVRAQSGGVFDPLTEADVERLLEITGDVPIAAVIPPGTPLKKTRSQLTKWGQAGKGKRGGRPRKKKPLDKKKCREKFLPIAIQLRETGTSYNAISEVIFLEHEEKIPPETIGGWCRRDKAEKRKNGRKKKR